MQEYDYLIKRILRKVPRYIKDDCYQAACVGLLRATEKKDKVNFFKAYAYRCMQNEVTKEVAKLHGTGNGLFALDKTTFLLYCEYKRRKNRDLDISDMKLSNKRIEIFDNLIHSYRYEFEEDQYNKNDWER